MCYPHNKISKQLMITNKCEGSSMKAIVYTSNAGHTKEYAELLSKRIGLPVFDLKNSSELPSGSDIIYMGWLCKAKIKGYPQAKRRFNIKALCPVGMWPSYLFEKYKVVAKNNTHDTPMFYLQGGLNLTKLHGFNFVLMLWMTNAVVKRLSVMETRNEAEEDLLVMTRDGKDTVSDENLNWVVKWYNEEYLGENAEA